MVQSAYGLREPEEELKDVGLKATAPRMKILEIFQKTLQEGNPRHLSAEDVYRLLVKENLDVGLATVYRVLTQFETAGILVRHHFGNDRATYEVDDGGRDIEKRQRQIAEKMGFGLESHALSLYGICADCQAKEKAKKEAQEG